AHSTCTEDSAPLAGCPSDQTLGTQGTAQSVNGTVTDPFGQTASVTSAPVNIDLTRPTVTVTLSPAAVNNWHNSPVIARFSCADALSGVTSCSADQILDRDGPDQSASGSATDAA